MNALTRLKWVGFWLKLAGWSYTIKLRRLGRWFEDRADTQFNTAAKELIEAKALLERIQR